MNRERIFRGVGVSEGFSWGEAFIQKPALEPKSISKSQIAKSQLASELARFDNALAKTETELLTLYDEVRAEMGRDFAEFITVQIGLLKDSEILKKTREFITRETCNVEFAYWQVLKSLAAPLKRARNPFFKERAADIFDIGNRVLKNLLGNQVEKNLLVSGTGSGVLVAHDLLPSEAFLLDNKRILGVVLESGGKTAHTSIMTKAKGIPAVVGCGDLLEAITEGDTIVVDGYRGLVILNPSEKRLSFYSKEKAQADKRRKYLFSLKEIEPITKDGKYVDISANIEFLAESVTALEYGAKGVGLFRTEYLYFVKRRLPTEEEQAEVFSEVAEKVKPYPVIIRTFDFGGDKVVPGYSEANPFLGWRSIRFLLDKKEIFLPQLKAILRASAKGNIKVMFPMVSTLEELRRCKLLLKTAQTELKERGLPYDENLEVGVMIETPSAALLANSFAKECNFFSIGSNDLTQYTLAVDRGNEKVSKLYDHFHPSVLKLIKETIDAGHRHGIWVGLCGEFARDPLGIILLIGLGIDELSMIPESIPQAKKIASLLVKEKVQEIANHSLLKSTSLEITRYLQAEILKNFPDLFQFLYEDTNKANDAQ